MAATNNPGTALLADQAKLLSLLAESRQKFLASFDGVSEADCGKHSAEGCWSILETVEHIVAAETAMLGLLQNTRRPRSSTTQDRDNIFLNVLTDRSRKLQSPEAGRPQGRFTTLREAGRAFTTVRDNTMRFVADTQEDLRRTEVTHPHPVAGVVTSYDMVVVMAKHAERHALQVQEIRNNMTRNTAAAGH